MTTEEKVLDRIRKLFAMGQQLTESPNEAAIAMRRCRALMDQHGITEADLAKSEFATNDIGAHKKRPKWFTHLAAGVAIVNDCRITGMRQLGVTTTTFSGFEQDVVLAELMLEYLTGAMDRAWVQFSKHDQVSGKGPHMSFNFGFASAVRRRLEEIAESRKAEVSTVTGNSLVVVKDALVSEQFGVQKYTNTKSKGPSDRGGYYAGRDAGRSVGLNAQVNNTNTLALTG